MHKGKITGWFCADRMWIIRCLEGEFVDIMADEDELPPDAKGLLVTFDVIPSRGSWKAINLRAIE